MTEQIVRSASQAKDPLTTILGGLVGTYVIADGVSPEQIDAFFAWVQTSDLRTIGRAFAGFAVYALGYFAFKGGKVRISYVMPEEK